MAGPGSLLCADYVNFSALPAIHVLLLACHYRHPSIPVSVATPDRSAEAEVNAGFSKFANWALLNRVPGSNIRCHHRAERAHVIDFPYRGDRERSRRAESQSAQFLDRSRPFLLDARGAHPPCGLPLYLFRSYRSEVVDRLRYDRARHRQFLHGDVLFSLRTVRVAGHCPKGTTELFARSPDQAWPAVRDLCVDDHSDRILRHLAAGAS